MKHPETEASNLLRRFKIEKLPVPVEDIAHQLGVLLSFRPFAGDISGMLFREGELCVLGVNSAHAHTRQRFTIAHELGHLILHEGKPMFVDKLIRVNMRDSKSSLGSDKEEVQANRFAAELIMPRDLIVKESKKRYQRLHSKRELDIIQELADLCEVSTSAMEYRLVNLGIINPQ